MKRDAPFADLAAVHEPARQPKRTDEHRPPVQRPLAGLKGVRPAAPAWYRGLDLEPAESMFVTVDGAAIEVLAWGERGRPGVLLAHGSWAHARWWSPVAAMLARDYRVASMSWAGMGGSQWRDSYSFAQQVDELFAAAEAASLFDSATAPAFVAHSFGGRALVQAMAERGQQLAGGILVDSAITPQRPDGPTREVRDPRYDSLEGALARFNLKPAHECDNLFILDDIARQGLVRDGERWRWRFDPAYIQKVVFTDLWPALASPRCPMAIIFGEDSASLASRERTAQQQQAPPGTPFIGIPAAGHHVMLDQPIALTATLRALLQRWLQP